MLMDSQVLYGECGSWPAICIRASVQGNGYMQGVYYLNRDPAAEKGITPVHNKHLPMTPASLQHSRSEVPR